MNFLDWFNVAAAATQTAAQVIKVVEGGSAPGTGPQKKEAVVAATVGALQTALAATGNSPLGQQEQQAFGLFAGLITDALVGLFNKTGQFQSSPQSVVVIPNP